ncbi:hypothetical protein I6F15_00075 [Bradyrhizobium sp. BRP14]|nr:hypothetical protein [Bradyrhizobium sp. BRP14]
MVDDQDDALAAQIAERQRRIDDIEKQRRKDDAPPPPAVTEQQLTALEQRFAALEKRVGKRLAEFEEALVLSFGDLRTEFDTQFAEARERTFTVDERAELVRLSRQVRKCCRQIEELRQDAEERGKGLRAVK